MDRYKNSKCRRCVARSLIVAAAVAYLSLTHDLGQCFSSSTQDDSSVEMDILLRKLEGKTEEQQRPSLDIYAPLGTGSDSAAMKKPIVPAAKPAAKTAAKPVIKSKAKSKSPTKTELKVVDGYNEPPAKEQRNIKPEGSAAGGVVAAQQKPVIPPVIPNKPGRKDNSRVRSGGSSRGVGSVPVKTTDGDEDKSKSKGGAAARLDSPKQAPKQTQPSAVANKLKNNIKNKGNSSVGGVTESASAKAVKVAKPVKPVKATKDIKPAAVAGDKSKASPSRLPEFELPEEDLEDFEIDPFVMPRESYSYNSVDLPEIIHGKKYSPENSHLPQAFYRSEYSMLLFSAVMADNISALRTLLDRGADINIVAEKNGYTPLQQAIKSRKHRAARYLITRGADLYAEDKQGKNILHIAATNNDFEAIKLLLAAKMEADVSDKAGNRAIHYITRDIEAVAPIFLKAYANPDNALIDMVELGSVQGALSIIGQSNPNARSRSARHGGDTPLIIAVKNRDIQMVSLLIKHGASPYAKNNQGLNAIGVAEENKYDEIVDIIYTVEIQNELSALQKSQSEHRLEQEIPIQQLPPVAANNNAGQAAAAASATPIAATADPPTGVASGSVADKIDKAKIERK